MGVSQGFGANGEMVGLGSRKSCCGHDRIGKAQMGMVVAMGAVALGKVLPVEDLLGGTSQLAFGEDRWGSISTHDTGHRNGPARNILTPETQDQCESSDFEGDQQRFVNEEVPTSHKAHCVVDEVTS